MTIIQHTYTQLGGNFGIIREYIEVLFLFVDFTISFLNDSAEILEGFGLRIDFPIRRF